MLGNPKPIADIRRQIVPLACGSVLEIGAGDGINFANYDFSRVDKLYALEPNQGMRRRAKQRLGKSRLDIEFLDLPGERIPLKDASIDTVLSTFTFCTIPGIVEAIQGIRRVLRPGGKLIFFEHGISPDRSVQRWQIRLEPAFRRAFGGCTLTRNIPELIAQGGFRIEQIEAAYLSPFPKSPSYCWWGTAVPKQLGEV
jgi:ubiquinone/menaquinone biosynthesis C-methylase UbiE